MAQLVDQEQQQRLRLELQQTIQALTTLNRALPASADVLYREISAVTDSLLDALYDAIRPAMADSQALFPISGIPPVLYSAERQALVDAAQTIQSQGAELVSLTADAATLTGQREDEPQSQVVAALKNVLASVCTLSDFTFPTHEPMRRDQPDLRFRVVVNDDVEYSIE